MSTQRFTLHAGNGSSRPIACTDRAAWALEDMLAAGAEGITAIDYPGVRLADAIFKLRQLGVDVETLTEPHGGDFPGHHARYRLRSKVERLSPMQVAA